MAETLHDRVFRDVLFHGALTTRRLIRDHGPKPNWDALIEAGYLIEKATIYGPVIALDDLGRDHASGGGKYHVAYICSAGHMANRAYLMDALELLKQREYSLGHHIYKGAGGVGRAARKGLKVNDQITRTVVRVPEQEMRRLKAVFRVDDIRNPYGVDRHGHYGEAVGYQSLYATISHGGISPERIRTLVTKTHKKHLEIWHAPLIIVTPHEAELHSLVRSINSRHRTKLEETYKKYPVIKPIPINDLVMLVNLAMPETQSAT